MTFDYSALERIREDRPLLHCISNLVTATDCANAALALGARPVMAQEPKEMAEIAAAARCCILNTGTPDDSKFEACIIAGQTANRLGKPVVLDPVGAGASAYRRAKLAELLEQVSPTLIRANHAETLALLNMESRESGVDSIAAYSQATATEAARALAMQKNCIVLLSGEEDIVTDGKQIVFVEGGSPLMSRITGAGCMLSVIAGAFLCCGNNSLQNAAEAAALWKHCGELAHTEGCGSFHRNLFDALTTVRGQDCAKHIQKI